MAEIVVITGGADGVGRAVARRFAEHGAKIAVVAVSADKLSSTATELVERGASAALALPCDLADPDQLAAAAARIELELGPIDIWINNALPAGTLREVAAPDELDRVGDAAYRSHVWGTLAALACMRARNHGTIVQVGAGLAMQGFTESLRDELLQERSRIELVTIEPRAASKAGEAAAGEAAAGEAAAHDAASEHTRMFERLASHPRGAAALAALAALGVLALVHVLGRGRRHARAVRSIV